MAHSFGLKYLTAGFFGKQMSRRQTMHAVAVQGLLTRRQEKINLDNRSN